VALELEDARDWETLCRHLHREDLAVAGQADASWPRAALSAAIASWAGTLTPFQAAFQLQRVGLAVGPVQDSEDVWRDVQFRTRGCFVEVDHPDIGPVEYPGVPARLSRTPGRVRSRGPRLGEHTAAVLREWLGLEEGALADLRDGGAIWQSGHDMSDSPATSRPATE
jgi:formyl-CoA transferase